MPRMMMDQPGGRPVPIPELMGLPKERHFKYRTSKRDEEGNPVDPENRDHGPFYTAVANGKRVFVYAAHRYPAAAIAWAVQIIHGSQTHLTNKELRDDFASSPDRPDAYVNVEDGELALLAVILELTSGGNSGIRPDRPSGV